MTYRLQDQVVHLRCGGRNACVASNLALLRCCERHLNAFGQGACAHRLGLEHDVVKTRRVHLLPDLDQVAIGALHQAVEHFHHVQARAQRAIDRAHFQADDAAAQDQHALGYFFQFQGTGQLANNISLWPRRVSAFTLGAEAC